MYFHRNVTNLNKAKIFYGEVQGLELLTENPDYNWCNFSLPASGISLSLTEDLKRGNKYKSVDRLEFSTNNLHAVKEKLEPVGIETGEITDLPGILSMFNIYDPDNNWVTFIGPPRVSE